MTRRLIEEWLPIAALGEESMRERRSMTALPPTYYLHVWWARRPLVASRAAILASLLPADADRAKFMRVLGIHGDPVASRKRIDNAKRSGEDLGKDVYGYKRAFSYSPTVQELEWLRQGYTSLGIKTPLVVDPTAGGGSIPFESIRLGLDTVSNDSNSVASIIQQQCIAAPYKYGYALGKEFERISKKFLARAEQELKAVFPVEPNRAIVEGYLWVRVIHCPYCEGEIPLSPSWRLSNTGAGVRLIPSEQLRNCQFEIVHRFAEHSAGTVSDGDAHCIYPSCNRVVDADKVRSLVIKGESDERLFAVVVKTLVNSKTKTGRPSEKRVRVFRTANPADDVSALISKLFSEKAPDWSALNIIPTEPVPPQHPKWTLERWGIKKWTQVFSPRQLYVHCVACEIYQELLSAEGSMNTMSEETKAAFHYLAFSLDKFRDYNSRMSAWHSGRGVLEHTFREHAFVFKWAFGEMAAVGSGHGLEWAIGQTRKCILELVALLDCHQPTHKGTTFEQPSLGFPNTRSSASIVLTCKSGDNLDHIPSASADVVVMDPPYYDNVMYAELSDFFYVWLKRTSGLISPELFRRTLTDKENEAVAAPSKYPGLSNAMELAALDYKTRMGSIFAECRRILKDDGIFTLMFTHKAVGAWDALTSGLVEAGFTVTASWPVNTEAESSMHIKEKAAANSTIFLVCRPRAARPGDPLYWEDFEPLVAAAVRKRIEEFFAAGIRGVDLYLSCFGPALEEFSKHWPLKRGAPRPVVAPTKKRGRKPPEAPQDPYAVTPEDALDAARREVKRWRLDKLARKRQVELDPVTEWFVLAWDAFQAPEFPYDEALRLARVVGLDLERDIIKRLAEKKASELILWDSSKRAAKGALGPADGSRAMIDALHHAAHLARTRNLDAARELLTKTGVDKNPALHLAMEAVLAVLPVGSAFTKVVEEKGPVSDAASDFDVLEHLRRLAFNSQVRQPEQLKFWES